MRTKLTSIKSVCLADRLAQLGHLPPPAAEAGLARGTSQSNCVSFVWPLECPLSGAESVGGHQGLLSSSSFYRVSELDRFLVPPSSCQGGSKATARTFSSVATVLAPVGVSLIY